MPDFERSNAVFSQRYGGNWYRGGRTAGSGVAMTKSELIARLAEQEGLTVYGVNYKDKPDAAFAWLEDLGNPYHAVGADGSGRTGIDWGLTGVPETFIIDGEGVIRYRHVGPVLPDAMKDKILPLIEELKK